MPENEPPIEKFEFQLGEAPEHNVYWVVKGGRAALKNLEGANEGKYRLPHFGIVDGGFISYIQTSIPAGPLQKESQDTPTDYDAVKMNLERCRDVARALLAHKELWGIHIHTILEFYEAIKGQSDTLLQRTEEYHPEFGDYRLPEISDADEARMREAASLALAHALESIQKS